MGLDRLGPCEEGQARVVRGVDRGSMGQNDKGCDGKAQAQSCQGSAAEASLIPPTGSRRGGFLEEEAFRLRPEG